MLFDALTTFGGGLTLAQAKAFGEIAARVVQEVAKLKRAAAVQTAYNAVRAARHLLLARPP